MDLHKTLSVIPILFFSAVVPTSAQVVCTPQSPFVGVDETGITIPGQDYPFPLDIEIPDPETSPFFNVVNTGVQNDQLDRFVTGIHINFDGSATIDGGATGELGTFTWTIEVPVGDMQFGDVSILPIEPFPVTGLLLSLNGTLMTVNGPGFETDPWVGTSGFHTKIVLSDRIGNEIIPEGAALDSLPDAHVVAVAAHFMGTHGST